MVVEVAEGTTGVRNKTCYLRLLANAPLPDDDEKIGREVYETREQRIRNEIIRFGEVVSTYVTRFVRM